ncbi:MAG TPA: urea ABC transporter permease subunit UrtB, partial [Verrucomicrobiota bacterium]|nr:urea ABC transporter permease subunit UrtB [Verrucomicrobiota bacterium]
TSSRLRRAIKTALDIHALSNPSTRMRRDAVTKLGQERNPEYLPHFERLLETEANREVLRALREAAALTRTASDEAAVRNAAIKDLGEMRSVNGLGFLQELEKECQRSPDKYGADTARVTRSAIVVIENYLWWGGLFGTLFRGLSLAAVLLVAALGLAITFGLMNVINMAHGEIMAVGAYTTFLVQGLFGRGVLFSAFGQPVSLPGMGLSGAAFDGYFIVALAASFVTAAIVGLALERGIIRFLYRRPLESLLATWGVSLILQQVFRHTFGAANVNVEAPSFLSGSFVVKDVLFAYNRLFIIGFAAFIVLATWLLLTRTSLGLQIRAVMQNRAMASCVGVRTGRVNMLTFAFGSGLAGMAGACLPPIAHAGPGLGQNYIIDCFMVVVLGGVGNLVGTVSASTGVGMANQILEPWVGAVLGKIIVLLGIILFLQWRPAGLFVTRSRSLDG